MQFQFKMVISIGIWMINKMMEHPAPSNKTYILKTSMLILKRENLLLLLETLEVESLHSYIPFLENLNSQKTTLDQK